TCTAFIAAFIDNSNSDTVLMINVGFAEIWMGQTVRSLPTDFSDQAEIEIRFCCRFLLCVRTGGPAFEPPIKWGAPSFRAFCERVGGDGPRFRELIFQPIGSMFPPLQRTQGWGTLIRGSANGYEKGGPPAQVFRGDPENSISCSFRSGPKGG